MTKEKTSEQIKQRLLDRRSNDFFGFETEDYIDFLEYEDAKEFLKKGITKKKWDGVRKKPTRKVIENIVKDYLDFAWGKANDMRGLSANRSIQHFIAWTWIIDEEFSREIEKEYNDNYHHYGKPILEKISEKYGFNWKKLDDGNRTNG